VTDSYIQTFVVMDTIVTFQVVGHDADDRKRRERNAAVARAAGWFHAINDSCTRFDPASELCRLSQTFGAPVPVSALLFQAVQFALAVAAGSGGAFDPTIGLQLETRGFDREFRSGHATRTDLQRDDTVNFRDVVADAAAQTITLLRPLLLDLGAVVKGLAVDMAARELQPLENFSINAGGDLYLGGHNEAGNPWSVGIRHPRQQDESIEILQVSDVAVCTSGDYARRSPAGDDGHHIVNPHTGSSPTQLASATVVACSAMLADALGTAAFVLGPVEGLALLQCHGVEGLLITPALERFTTHDMRRLRHRAYA
jgi:thiamine biosynthesis lipoprotein